MGLPLSFASLVVVVVVFILVRSRFWKPTVASSSSFARRLRLVLRLPETIVEDDDILICFYKSFERVVVMLFLFFFFFFVYASIKCRLNALKYERKKLFWIDLETVITRVCLFTFSSETLFLKVAFDEVLRGAEEETVVGVH